MGLWSTITRFPAQVRYTTTTISLFTVLYQPVIIFCFNLFHKIFTWRATWTLHWPKSVPGMVWMVLCLPLFSSELSFAVPVANALSFLCTLLTGKLLGEEFGGKSKSYIWWYHWYYTWSTCPLSFFLFFWKADIFSSSSHCCRGCHGNDLHHGWHLPVCHKLHWWAASQAVECNIDHTLMKFGIKATLSSSFCVWIPQQGGKKEQRRAGAGL